MRSSDPSSCTQQYLLAHVHCCLLEKAGALQLNMLELASSLCAGCVETAYLFPGIGLGCIVSRANRLRDEGFVAAAEALAKCVTDGVHLTRCRLATLLIMPCSNKAHATDDNSAAAF